MTSTHSLVRADRVQTDDMIDLEGDKFVPAEESEHTYQYEYATVWETERETEDCIRIDFDLGSYGFPPDHLLKKLEV